MASRTRNFAFIVYPDSAPENWLENLNAQHLRCAVSPLHDKDVYTKDDPDTGTKKGDVKKAHYHVLVKFDSVKTLTQVADILKKVLELPERPKLADIEIVGSPTGYFRYLTHKDDKDKAQYNEEDIIYFGGASAEDFESDKNAEWKILKEIIKFCSENGITSYCLLVDYCVANNFDWFVVVCGRFSYVINSYLKSLSAE